MIKKLSITLLFFVTVFAMEKRITFPLLCKQKNSEVFLGVDYKLCDWLHSAHDTNKIEDVVTSNIELPFRISNICNTYKALQKVKSVPKALRKIFKIAETDTVDPINLAQYYKKMADLVTSPHSTIQDLKNIQKEFSTINLSAVFNCTPIEYYKIGDTSTYPD